MPQRKIVFAPIEWYNIEYRFCSPHAIPRSGTLKNLAPCFEVVQQQLLYFHWRKMTQTGTLLGESCSTIYCLCSEYPSMRDQLDQKPNSGF